MITTNPSKLPLMIATALAAHTVPMVWGSPAIGKSDIIKSVAKVMKLLPIDLRLSQCDPTDMNGIPHNVKVRENEYRLNWSPPMDIPLAHDEIPAGYDGWLLFLDEANAAPVDVAKAAYKLMLDRQVGQHDLHPKCYIAAAGNLETDRGLVNKMPTPLLSRLVHFQLEPDLDYWMDWANATDRAGDDETPNIHTDIQDFLLWKKELFYKFDPNSDERTFPAPRTWEFASRLMRANPSSEVPIELISGAIGVGPAQEFLTYIKNKRELPTLAQIIADPKGTSIPKQADLVYTLFSSMVREVDHNNMEAIATYVDRADMEYQYFLFNAVNRHNPAALGCPAGIKWMAKYARETA